MPRRRKRKRLSDAELHDVQFIERIAARPDIRENGRLQSIQLEALGIDRKLLNSYRRKLQRINKEYFWQRSQLLMTIDDPFTRAAKLSDLTTLYQLEDLSGKVRSNEELEELLRRLQKHTVSQVNRHMRDNYVKALENNGAPSALINEIKRLGGSTFYEMYFRLFNADIPYIYAIGESGNIDLFNKLASDWARAGLQIHQDRNAEWRSSRK
jgi:hypothetical protein